MYLTHNNKKVKSTFTRTTKKRKYLKEKLSSKKNYRRLTLTANHRFIALMLRFGKKTTSYSVFLNALSQCKQAFDRFNQGVSLNTMEIVDNKKNNNIQNFPIKYSLSKHVNSPPFNEEFITVKKDRTCVSSVGNNVEMYRGTCNRFQRSLFVFSRNHKLHKALQAPGSFSNDTKDLLGLDLKAKLYYNFADLYTPVEMHSLSKKHTLLGHSTQKPVQVFRFNKLLISRRVLVKKPSTPLFAFQNFVLENSTTYSASNSALLSCYSSTNSTNYSALGTRQSRVTELSKSSSSKSKSYSKAEFEAEQVKGTEIKSSISRNLAVETSVLNLSKIVSLSKVLQSKTSLQDSVLPNPYLKKEQGTNLLTASKATYKKIFDTTLGNKKQEDIKTPRSFLLQKKEINLNISRGIHKLERTRIGIDSVSRVSPSVEIRKVRIGGATYAVPYVPHNRRQEGLGIRWLILHASNKKKQGGKHSSELCLANELAESLKNEGQSIRKRDQSHQTAAANRAYTRYRWW